ncbi:MAG: M23 family metallopeptidase [Flavobacteriaceae bacterium]|nr:M23 family metallopeptidase [Flavobacteriaceae bacterium]
MADYKSKKNTFKEKLLNKYRMVIINEDTFEEKISFKITMLNVFVLGGVLSILLIVGTTLLISLTSLREYVPGHSSLKLKKEAANLIYKVDSLDNILEVNNRYITRIKEVLIGDVSVLSFDKDSVFETVQLNREVVLKGNSSNDSLFRLEVERENKYSFFEEAKKNEGVVFFAPVSGVISNSYNLKEKHFAVDIVVKGGTPIKAIADGTVIFSEWTVETGHVIIIEHSNGYISIYKRNGTLHKFQGDFVKSGEVIASSGSRDELTIGSHLHFELWSDGYPVNPINFIDFE